MRRVNTLAVLLVLALSVAAACNGTASSSSAPPDESFPLETLTPVDPTEEPTAEPEESFPTEPPLITAAPEESFPTEPPLITPAPGSSVPATSCSDSVDEQAFYAAVVAQVAWDVYCPALPAGWHIETGRYRLAGHGFLEIAYENRSGDRLELFEGGFCDAADGCVPDGDDAGAAAFGDLVGTLVAGSDGSWAIVVDRGAEISWLVIGRSIDEATFRDLAALFLRVEP